MQLKHLLEAIDDFYSDSSQSIEDAIDGLEQARELIDEKLGALNDDLRDRGG